MRHDCEKCTNDAYDEYLKKYPDASHCMYCGRYLLKNDYNKVQEVEIIDRKDSPMGDKEERHPAYGQLSFSRGTGGHSNLYGSSVRNQHTITLRIATSVKHTSPYHESYFDREPLIEVVMSHAQFAEAITSFNMGGGVPVTLKYVRGQYMPLCGEVSKSQRANDDLKEKLGEFADKITAGSEKIEAILDKKGAINKGERKTISNVYKSWIGDLKHNLPFLHECMTESYEKTIANAKSEIEAFYIHGLQKLGIEQLDKKQIVVNESGRLEYKKDDVVDADYEETK